MAKEGYIAFSDHTDIPRHPFHISFSQPPATVTGSYIFYSYKLVFNKPKTMNSKYNITYFCLINTRNVDFEWYPWTLENWRHCLGLKRVYILYNIIIISFGMRFSTFELHSVVVHVFVLVLFLKRYTRRAKMTSTLSLCSLLYITEALSKENLCSVS